MIHALDARDARGIDHEIWELGAVTLTRADALVLVDLEPDRREIAIRSFARSGVSLAPTAMMSEPRPPLVAAIATTLDTFTSVALCFDMLTLRAVSVAAATRVYHRQPGLLRRPSASERGRCRAILRDEDRVLAWHRVVWADQPVLRRRVAGLRPVVFDREALRRSDERWVLTSERAVERWLKA